MFTPVKNGRFLKKSAYVCQSNFKTVFEAFFSLTKINNHPGIRNYVGIDSYKVPFIDDYLNGDYLIPFDNNLKTSSTPRYFRHNKDCRFACRMYHGSSALDFGNSRYFKLSENKYYVLQVRPEKYMVLSDDINELKISQKAYQQDNRKILIYKEDNKQFEIEATILDSNHLQIKLSNKIESKTTNGNLLLNSNRTYAYMNCEEI